MNVLLVNLESLTFMLNWLSTHKITLAFPPAVLNAYELQLDIAGKSGIVHKAQFKEDTDTSCRTWEFEVYGMGEKSSENLYLQFFDDGTVQEVDEEGAGTFDNPYGVDMKALQYTHDNDDGFQIYRSTTFTHCICMHFLAAFQPELREYTDKQVKVTKIKPNGKPKKQVYTRISLWKYIKDVQSSVKRLPPSKCDFCFGVRGHYRHYKSGKVVFVHPYEKNKGKPQRKDTRYVLPETKVAKR